MSGGKITTKKDCKECPAICCKNLALTIGRPENRQELEDLKWQLHFDTVKVFISNRRWHQLIEGKCMYLSEDNKCIIYDRRPDKCRKHNPPNCEFFGKFYDIMLSTPEELEDYWKSKKIRKKKV